MNFKVVQMAVRMLPNHLEGDVIRVQAILRSITSIGGHLNHFGLQWRIADLSVCLEKRRHVIICTKYVK
jgi:hypothetical protein